MIMMSFNDQSQTAGGQVSNNRGREGVQHFHQSICIAWPGHSGIVSRNCEALYRKMFLADLLGILVTEFFLGEFTKKTTLYFAEIATAIANAEGLRLIGFL